MLDVHGQNPSSAREKRSPRANGTLLNGWIRQQVDMPYVRVKSRLRGNNLHLLLEGSPCPSGAVVLPKLRQALSVTALADQLPPESPPVYRVIVYGRLPQCSTPEWTESFVPRAADRPVLRGQRRLKQRDHQNKQDHDRSQSLLALPLKNAILKQRASLCFMQHVRVSQRRSPVI
jgi:hypothetical protein